VRKEMIDPFYEQTEVLAREDLAYMVTRPRHSGIGELWTMPTEQLSARPARSRRTVAHRVATETDACG
jgi:hypothetical protein